MFALIIARVVQSFIKQQYVCHELCMSRTMYVTNYEFHVRYNHNFKREKKYAYTALDFFQFFFIVIFVWTGELTEGGF